MMTRYLTYFFAAWALIACSQAEDEAAVDATRSVEAVSAEAGDVGERTAKGKPSIQGLEGTDQCTVFESSLVPSLFEVDEAAVNYRRSIPSARAGHVVCSATWDRQGPPYQNEVSLTLLSNRFDSAGDAVSALEQNVATLARGMTITVGGKERTRKTEFGDWMDGPGDKAIFTSKGALMMAGKARLVTISVKATGDEAEDRAKARELGQQLLEAL